MLAVPLLGAGVAVAVAALATYYARYSRFDGLFGEIDSAMYAQLTQMAPAEKGALVLGLLLVSGALLLGMTGVIKRRTASHK